jgi:hypothetical protein
VIPWLFKRANVESSTVRTRIIGAELTINPETGPTDILGMATHVCNTAEVSKGRSDEGILPPRSVAKVARSILESRWILDLFFGPVHTVSIDYVLCDEESRGPRFPYFWSRLGDSGNPSLWVYGINRHSRLIEAHSHTIIGDAYASGNNPPEQVNGGDANAYEHYRRGQVGVVHAGNDVRYYFPALAIPEAYKNLHARDIELFSAPRYRVEIERLSPDVVRLSALDSATGGRRQFRAQLSGILPIKVASQGKLFLYQTTRGDLEVLDAQTRQIVLHRVILSNPTLRWTLVSASAEGDVVALTVTTPPPQLADDFVVLANVASGRLLYVVLGKEAVGATVEFHSQGAVLITSSNEAFLLPLDH